MEHPSSDKFTLDTERELRTLGQESGTSAVSNDRVKLSVSGADKSVSSVDGPVSEEPAQNKNFQMEEDGSLKQSILRSKLLDHPYYKSPLDAVLVYSELKGENQMAGGKSSQTASPVDDEQLSTCLSGMHCSLLPTLAVCCPFQRVSVLPPTHGLPLNLGVVIPFTLLHFVDVA